MEPFRFGVGGVKVGDSEPADWAVGSHHAECTVEGIAENEISAGLFETVVSLSDCEDDGNPVLQSLGLWFQSSKVDGDLGLLVGARVKVNFVVGGEYDWSDSWYSLREATGDRLLLAAFCDSGPGLEPKDPSGATIDSEWLQPLHAELDDFICAPLEGLVGAWCEMDDTPQLAAVRFDAGGTSVSVPGGQQEAVATDYAVYLGFAGAPDVCDGGPHACAVHGLLFFKE